MISPEQKYAREQEMQHAQQQSPPHSHPNQQDLQEIQGQQAQAHQHMEEAEHRMEEAEHRMEEAEHRMEQAEHLVQEAAHQVHDAVFRVHEAEHEVHEAEHRVHEAEHEMQQVDQQIQEAVQQQQQQESPAAELPPLEEDDTRYHHRPGRNLHDSESSSVSDCLSYERYRCPWRGSPKVPGSAENVENMAAAGFVAPRSIPIGQDMTDRRAGTPPLSDSAVPAGEDGAQDEEEEEEEEEEESAYDQLRKTKNTHTPLW